MSDFANEKHSKVSLDAVFPIMKETLEGGGNVTFKPCGISMLPLLRQGIDSVRLQKPTGSLKRLDIIFYRRANGQFVLHRIVGKNKNGYILRGDNQVENEYNIQTDSVIAVATHIVRGNKEISCNSALYKLYARFFRPLRRVKIFVGRNLKRLK